MKRQSRKAQNKKAKANLWKKIMTKLEKEDKQEKDTQKDFKILTKLLTKKF